MKVKSLVFDSGIWIDALNGKTTPEVNLLHHAITIDQSIVIFPIIAREVLQGIRDDKMFQKVYNNLEGFSTLSLDSWQTEIGAAKLFRNLRKKGITIRKPNDCEIAFLAIHFDLILVHNDKDFDLIAQGSDLAIF